MRKVKKPRVLERHVRLKFRTLLQLRGWYVFWNLQGLGSYSGLSDLTIVKNGVVIWLEVKAPGGTQRPKQIEFEAKVTRAGGHYVCAAEWSVLEKYILDLSTKLGIQL